MAVSRAVERIGLVAAATLLVLMTVPAAGGGQADSPQSPQAQRLLQEIRHAIAGGEDLSVRRIEASGELRTYAGSDLHRHQMTLVLEPAQAYHQRRVLTYPPSIQRFGFEQSRLIRELTSTSATLSAGVLPLTPEMERAEMRRLQLEATRLVAAWLMSEAAPLPIRYEYRGVGKAGQVETNVFDVQSGGEVIATIYVDSLSHLPIGLTFTQTRHVTSASQPPPRAMGPDELRAWAASHPPAQGATSRDRVTETRWSLTDRKMTGGLSFASSLIIAEENTVREEWHFQSVKVAKAPAAR